MDGEPRSLCLYDVGWNDLNSGWTAKRFLERIRWWFAATAYGSLHGDQQPLEPLMSTTGMRLVVSADVLGNTTEGTVVFGGNVYKSDDEGTLFLRAVEDSGSRGLAKLNWTVATVKGPVQQHGRIATGPRTLLELIKLLGDMGADLPAALGKVFDEKVSGTQSDLGRHLLVLVTFPVQRIALGPIEEGQTFAFLVPKPLGEIGVDIGYLGRDESSPPRYGIMLSASRKVVGKSPVVVLEVFREFSPEVARQASGMPESSYRRVALVGAGALGSEIADMLARTGIPNWAIVDDDVLLPHNLARHALDAFAVGTSKAQALSSHIRNLLNVAAGSALKADFLNPISATDPITTALEDSELVIDASASQPVLRSLGYRSRAARAVSVFLNPSGTDLVLLAEDKARDTNLVLLEHYYLRALVDMPSLTDHLSMPPGEGYRYGTSCRYPSVRIPGPNVATLAGIAAGRIAQLSQLNGASATIFRLDSEAGTVSAVSVAVGVAMQVTIEDWKVSLLGAALDEMQELRTARLPNETGGVLVGTIDRKNRAIHVVAALPAPPDSKERTTSFIRGVAGLRARVEEVSRLTQGQVEYIGEWHSHPPMAGTQASHDDQQLYKWVYDELAEAEAPPIMVIAGEGGFSVFATRDAGDELLSAAVPQH